MGMAHAFNINTCEAEAGRSPETSLVYRVSPRTAWMTQRKPVSKIKQINKTKH